MEGCIPQKLSQNDRTYFYSDLYFSKQKNKSVRCYFHTKQQGGMPIGMHGHEFYEINIITNGRGVHYINNQKIDIKEGDVFVLPPNVEHGYFDLENLEVFHVLLAPSFFDIYKSSLQAMNGYTSLFSIEPILRGQEKSNAFLRLHNEQLTLTLNQINQIMQFDNDDVYHYNIQASKVFELVCLFCSFFTLSLMPKKNNQESQGYAPLMVYAMEYMKKNYSKKITIEMVARKISVSTATLKRYFSQIAKVSPKKYLTNIRITASKKLLVETDKTLTQIAMDCGFFDTAHFLKQFKQNQNISPSEYRKRNNS